jgi:hypothetical protein
MTRPWPEIDRFYSELPADVPALDAMRALVRQICESRYATGVHAWTSMCDLCIVQAEVSYPYDGPYLRISPHQDGTLEFRYVDAYLKDRQWVRVVPAEKGFDRLCRFFAELHWFVETTATDEA